MTAPDAASADELEARQRAVAARSEALLREAFPDATRVRARVRGQVFDPAEAAALAAQPDSVYAHWLRATGKHPPGVAE